VLADSTGNRTIEAEKRYKLRVIMHFGLETAPLLSYLFKAGHIFRHFLSIWIFSEKYGEQRRVFWCSGDDHARHTVEGCDGLTVAG